MTGILEHITNHLQADVDASSDAYNTLQSYYAGHHQSWSEARIVAFQQILTFHLLMVNNAIKARGQ